jgi:glycosyltransferase involved in cell wall biosynthesis
MSAIISVVVPVYKVEPYIRRCIESIIGQTYTNLEIFLVDDGSPDCCGKICDEYAQKDSRIKVIHKVNGGVSDARNVALDLATGEYITFIDSDDYVSKYYIEYLYNNLLKEKADISCCGVKVFFKDAGVINDMPGLIDDNLKVFDTASAIKEMLYSKYFSNSPCGKLYKLELFNNIRYPRRKLFEDMFATYKLIDVASNVVYGPQKLYYYFRGRKESITGSVEIDKRMDVIEAEKEIMLFLEDKYPDIINAIYYKIVVSCFATLARVKNKNYTNNKNVEELWKFIKLYRANVIKDKSVDVKNKTLAVLSYGGLGCTVRCCRLFKR